MELPSEGCRSYDAQVGRFITRDTCLDQKPYAYCDGDPVNCIDPTGHDGWDDTIMFGTFVCAVGGIVAWCGTGPVSIPIVGVGSAIIIVGIVGKYLSQLDIDWTQLGPGDGLDGFGP